MGLVGRSRETESVYVKTGCVNITRIARTGEW